MVVADEIKVADDDARGRDGFVWVIGEKRRKRWRVFRRAAIAHILSSAAQQPALELTQASSLFKPKLIQIRRRELSPDDRCT